MPSTPMSAISSMTPVKQEIEAQTMRAPALPPPPPPPPPPVMSASAPIAFGKRKEVDRAPENQAAAAAEPSMVDVLKELSRVQKKVVDMISSPRSNYLNKGRKGQGIAHASELVPPKPLALPIPKATIFSPESRGLMPLPGLADLNQVRLRRTHIPKFHISTFLVLTCLKDLQEEQL
ncbi:hypothetical protein HDU97_010054 [Phlyctochytrium planicorne]|nr:hypothetical protein HDU97_010054 [Phlyctochytrium planicorne]